MITLAALQALVVRVVVCTCVVLAVWSVIAVITVAGLCRFFAVSGRGDQEIEDRWGGLRGAPPPAPTLGSGSSAGRRGA